MNFWDVHGFIFLFFMFFLPRLTMLLTGIAFSFSGLFFWLGWFIAPRLTVAILATTYYWNTNIILCLLTWFWAFGGEGTEKKVVKNRVFQKR